MSTASENELGALHKLVAVMLKDRIKGELCTAADINAAIKFLKDNNITCAPSADHLKDLRASLQESTSPVEDADLTAALENIGFLGGGSC